MFKKIINLPNKIDPNLRKIIGNTGWLFSEKIFQMGFGLLVGAWVARYLGTEKFGTLNYVIALVALLSPVAKLGLDQIVVRDIARDRNCKEDTLGTSFLLKLGASFLTLMLVLVTIATLKPGNSEVLWLTGIISAGTVFKSFDSIEYWFRSQVQAKYVVWARNSAYIAINIVKIILIQLQAPLVTFAIALAVEQVLAAVGMIIAYQLTGNLIRAWKVNWVRIRSLLKDSYPLILSGIVIAIYMRIDQIMLGQMVGEAAVGVYSVAVKISELWYFIPNAIINSVFPSIVQAKEAGDAVYYKRLQKIFNLLVTMSYIFAIATTFLAPYIINLLYGKQYAEAAGILTISIWAGVFVSLGLARETWLTTEGLMKFSAATTAVGAVVNILLNSLLIGRYGATGAAIATVIAQMFASYLAGAFYPQTWAIFVRQTKALFLIGWWETRS